jgi:hypothetical protein
VRLPAKNERDWSVLRSLTPLNHAGPTVPTVSPNAKPCSALTCPIGSARTCPNMDSLRLVTLRLSSTAAVAREGALHRPATSASADLLEVQICTHRRTPQSEGLKMHLRCLQAACILPHLAGPTFQYPGCISCCSGCCRWQRYTCSIQLPAQHCGRPI